MNENQEISESTKKVIYSAKDEFGKTALHFAAENGLIDICKLIIEQIKDKNPRNISGYTPLHFAVIRGNLGICKYIIKNEIHYPLRPFANSTILRVRATKKIFNTALVKNTQKHSSHKRTLKRVMLRI